jgi:flagellar biosynthesis protein FlhB
MIEHLLHPRITESKDWAILFVLAFAIIVLLNSVYENRFGDFMNLIFSDKYSKVYRDGSHLKGSFTISLFFVQVILLCLFYSAFLSFFCMAQRQT